MNHQAAFTQFFSELEDPRQTTKIAYPFFDVVFLTVCAAIGGAHGWEDFFDITRAADETASKPHPLMLEQIMAHCGVSPRQALMVGDASFDLMMARNAGMDSVAVSYGAQSAEALQQYEPRLTIDHFSELQAWLSRAR